MKISFPRDLTGWRAALAAAASGVLLSLAFPPFGLHFTAWFAFVPLLLAVEGKRPARAMLLGLLAGFVFFAVTMPWLYTAMTVYGNLGQFTSVMLMFLLDLYLALFFAAFAGLAARLPEEAALLMPAVYFVALEWLRGALLTGFPWALLGHTQHGIPAMIQIASITGAAGVSFLIMLVNGALWHYLRQTRRGPVSAAVPLAAAAVVAVNVFWGLGEIRAVNTEPAHLFRAALIQGNIPQNEKWDERFKETVALRHLEMTREAAANKPHLIVWPEAAAPFYYGKDYRYTEFTRRTVMETGVPLLFGGLAYDEGPDGDRWHNSAFIITPDGAERRYDKIHLVPFGEYVPLRGLLSFAAGLTQAIAGDTAPGAEAQPLKVNGFTAGVQICYEIIFPEGTRDFARKGARLIVNITNDAWYGRSAASAQHLMALPFRAVENRVPILRAANTGISCFVTATGEIVHPTQLFVTTIAAGTLPLPETPQTFYTRFGEVFAYLCIAAAVWYLIAGRGRLKRKAGHSPVEKA